MKRKSVKKNYIYNMLYQLVLIVTPIITTPYIARKLGSTGNGIYGFTVSIVTYFILFGSLGTALYGQREIAYNQNDKQKRSNVFWEILTLRIITMSISTVAFYIIFCTSGQYSIYYKILLLEILANMLDISWFYQGMEDFKKTVIRNFIVKIISIVFIFIFIKSPDDLNKYLFIYTLSTLFGSLTLWIGIWKYVFKPKKLNIKTHLPLIISLFIPQVAIQIYTVLDKTMIGAITNNMNEVGYYDQAQKVVKLLLTIVTAIGTVMLPRISACYAEGDKKAINVYMKKTFSFTFMIAIPLMFGIIAVSSNFCPLFFGPGYDKVPTIMNMLSIIIIIISLASITGTQYLLPLNRQKEYTISVIIGAITNVILNFILINYCKSYGAAIATVVAEFTVTAVQCYFVRKDFDLKEIFKSSINYIISSIIMMMVCIFIDKVMIGRMTVILTQVIVGVITYFGVLFVLRDKFLLDTLNDVIFSRFKKKNN